MNPSSMLLVFSLLLLSLLHSKSEGIRLDEGLSTDPQNLLKISGNSGCDDEEANISNQVHNSISRAGTIKEAFFESDAILEELQRGKNAKNRKLLVSPSIPSTHHTTSKKTKKMIENNENAKGNREGEETKVNWVVTSLKQYEEQADMAEMDYTAPTRKPPIHN